MSKVLIIGGGIAGLSSGCYLQQNGFQTEVFEAHTIPGGLLTGWSRKGFNIDGCIHGFLGSSDKHPYYHMWNELLPMDEMQFIDYEQMYVFMFGDGQEFIIHSDLCQFQEYLLTLSPEDSVLIMELIKDTRAIGKLDMSFMIKPRELYGVIDYVSMLRLIPFLRLMRKWSKVTVEEFSQRFKHPLLRKSFRSFLSPILMHMFVHSAMDQNISGYPVIGSLGISKLLVKKYGDLGGILHTQSKVNKIIVENHEAVGLTLQDDSDVKGDIIISAMDIHSTFYDLLDGNYIDEDLRKTMNKLRLNTSRIQVSLGISINPQKIPHSFKIILEEPVVIGTEKHNHIDVLCYSEDTNAAHSFSGINRAIQAKWNTMYPVGIIAQTLRLFGQGMKVVVEIAAMAADAGVIPVNEDVLVIAGSGRGADTAVILRAANSHRIFDMVIKEIIAKPSHI